MDNSGYLLVKISMEMKTALTNKLLPFNVTAPQWAVLKDISCHPEGTTPAKIAERTYSERPTITGILVRLKTKEFITTKDNPHDKRSNLIFLTDLGMAIKNGIEALSDDIMETALSGVTDQEKLIFMKVLQQIHMNLDKE